MILGMVTTLQSYGLFGMILTGCRQGARLASPAKPLTVHGRSRTFPKYVYFASHACFFSKLLANDNSDLAKNVNLQLKLLH